MSDEVAGELAARAVEEWLEEGAVVLNADGITLDLDVDAADPDAVRSAKDGADDRDALHSWLTLWAAIAPAADPMRREALVNAAARDPRLVLWPRFMADGTEVWHAWWTAPDSGRRLAVAPVSVTRCHPTFFRWRSLHRLHGATL